MTFLNVAAIVGLVAAFTAFMLALAYAERQTRSLSPQKPAIRK